ncbi:23S rRNA (uracil(1939)-C(5))-methyltransferase RlmD, partial [Paenibacillus glucanolyticus]
MKKNRKGSDTRRSGKPAAPSAALLDLPVAKNDEVVIDIIGMNHDGEGVGRADGYT